MALLLNTGRNLTNKNCDKPMANNILQSVQIGTSVLVSVSSGPRPNVEMRIPDWKPLTSHVSQVYLVFLTHDDVVMLLMHTATPEKVASRVSSISSGKRGEVLVISQAKGANLSTPLGFINNTVDTLALAHLGASSIPVIVTDVAVAAVNRELGRKLL